MKALLSIFFILTIWGISVELNQETETLQATFVEFADDSYIFKDKDDYTHEFPQIKKEVLDTYNLKEDSFKGKSFLITYETDIEEDEDGDDISVNIIVALKLVE